MSCCITPSPTLYKTATMRGEWCVVSTCEVCGATRMESPYFDLEAEAEHELLRYLSDDPYRWRTGEQT